MFSPIDLHEICHGFKTEGFEILVELTIGKRPQFRFSSLRGSAVLVRFGSVQFYENFTEFFGILKY